MNKLTFSFNWNNKLDCNAFTTIRLRNDNKYYKGASFNTVLAQKGKEEINKGDVMVEEVKHFKIDKINEFVALLDTGYCRADCIKTIQTMYKNIVPDWNKQDLSLILLVKQK